MYTEIILYILNQKGNIMKSLLVILSTVFAMSAMATEVTKPATTPTVTVTAKKEEVKPVKSETKVEAKETKAK
jgi:hypothetical protein